MIYMMLLTHLIGDYLLQTDVLVRWKMRSLWGVLAHGAIVTAVTVLGAALVDPAWWSYAALIGVVHTLVDVVRARFIRTKDPGRELFWYVLDQVVHVTVIVWVVILAQAALDGTPQMVWGGNPSLSRVLGYAIGYALLLNPAWVFLRFTVRGVWGSQAAPTLDQGEKYGPMVERVVIATGVLTGQFTLALLVLVLRRVTAIHVQEGQVGIMVRQTEHWGEALLSTLLAIGVGLILRLYG